MNPALACVTERDFTAKDPAFTGVTDRDFTLDPAAERRYSLRSRPWSFYISGKAEGLTYVSPGQRPGKTPRKYQALKGRPSL